MKRTLDPRGFTMLETVAAVLIIGVAAAIATGAIMSSLPRISGSQLPVTARELARDLLEEVLSKPFDSPTGAHGATRATFTCCDDYNGYVDGPPATLPNGTPEAGGAGFTRTVKVLPVATSAPGGAAIARAGATEERVEVTVSWAGGSVTLVGLKDELQPSIIPPAKSAIMYVDGSRVDGAGASKGSVSFLVVNHTQLPLTISSFALSWSPKTTLSFGSLLVETTSGQVLAQWTGSAAAGGSLALNQSFTIASGQELKVVIGGMASGSSAVATAPYTFAVDWKSTAGTVYETDVPSGCPKGAVSVTFSGPPPALAMQFRLTGNGSISGQDGSGGPEGAAVAFDKNLVFGPGASSVSVSITGNGALVGTGNFQGVSGLQTATMSFGHLFQQLAVAETSALPANTFAGGLSLTGQQGLTGPGPYLVKGPLTLTGQAGIGSSATPAVVIVQPTAVSQLSNQLVQLTGQGGIVGVLYMDLSLVPGSVVTVSHDILNVTGQGGVQGLVVVNGPSGALQFSGASIFSGFTGNAGIVGETVIRVNGGVTGAFPVATLTGNGSLQADCASAGLASAALGQ